MTLACPLGLSKDFSSILHQRSQKLPNYNELNKIKKILTVAVNAVSLN